MADNTLNFDLDAPAVPTLTLDPTPAAVPQEEGIPSAPSLPPNCIDSLRRFIR